MDEEKFLIRTCMLYDFKMGKKATESHRSICEAFGESAISERSCQRWFHQFRSGDESLEDEERGRPPPAIDDDDLLEKIEADPTKSSRELARELNCDQKTIINHLHHLGKLYRLGTWSPHELTNSQKICRKYCAENCLRLAKNSGFFESIVTCDEKWIFFDNPERKPQWLSPGQLPKPTPKPNRFGKKVMLCVWWNCYGVVHFEFLEPGKTLNSDLYVSQLGRVNQALKHQGVKSSKTKLLQDNAKPHTSEMTLQKLEELGWEVIPHPPYSPDLAPSDYHLFRSMQHSLAGTHFKEVKEIQNFVSNFFKSQPRQFFADGIQTLRERWKTVIDNNGEYILD